MNISVVIPLYNQAERIELAISSVLAQNYSANEIIVVNDGSTDNSAQIVSQFDCVRLISQSNEGPSAARNLGMKAAKSEWIAFLDADDTWTSSHLKELSELHKHHPEANVLASGYQFIYNNKVQSAYIKQARANIVENFFAICCHADLPLTASSVLIKKTALYAVNGFNEQIRSGEDQDLWARLAIRNTIALNPIHTVNYWLGDRLYGYHHLVLEPAPQIHTYKDLLLDMDTPTHMLADIQHLAHLTVLHSIKHNLMVGNKTNASHLLKAHWAIKHDRWYWFAKILLILPSFINKKILSNDYIKRQLQ